MEVEDWNKVLVAGFSVSSFLFILSEVLSMSSCKYNGVFQFVVSGCYCVGGRDINIDIRIEDE